MWLARKSKIKIENQLDIRSRLMYLAVTITSFFGNRMDIGTCEDSFLGDVFSRYAGDRGLSYEPRQVVSTRIHGRSVTVFRDTDM
jgi:hypothetical protein